jgi:dCMP deaminase
MSRKDVFNHDSNREVDFAAAYEVCCGGAENPVFSGIKHDPNLKKSAHSKILNSLKDLKEYKPTSATVDNIRWHKRFLSLCKLISTWSKDPSTKVGACIVDDKQRIISLAYNGFARNVQDTEERMNNRDIKYELTLHAEVNALLFAKQDLNKCTLYNYPLLPCIRCTVQIVQSGITTVVSPKLPEDLIGRWGDSVNLSKEIFEETKVRVIEI